jgi:aminopeptidase YwaD
MKKIFTLVFFVLIFLPDTFAQTTLKERLEKHVYTLASDEMRGRKPGTKYSRMASEYIINQWKEIGIEPFFDNSYIQPFNKDKFQNIIGIIHGNDPELKNEYIVIGAHYDHVGTILGIIHNGADDNASGTAMVIELARELKQIQSNLKRSIILVAFDAEEMGLLGSIHFITHWEEPLENIKLMIGVDMVGWYKKKGKIVYHGSATIQNGKDLILNSEIIPTGLNVDAKKFEAFLGDTDTWSFAMKRIPTFFVHTGKEPVYHTFRDDADLIDYYGMALITEHLAKLVEIIAQDEDLKSSGKFSPKHKPRQRVELGASANLGNINAPLISGKNDYEIGTSLGVGFVSQINFEIFAIRPELEYEHFWIIHPSGTISTNNITVPLSLVLQTREMTFPGGDIFFGGYYSYRFNGKQGGEALDFLNTFNSNEFGLNFGFDIFLKPIKFGYTFRIPLTDFTKSTGVYNGNKRNRVLYLSTTFTF